MGWGWFWGDEVCIHDISEITSNWQLSFINVHLILALSLKFYPGPFRLQTIFGASLVHL